MNHDQPRPKVTVEDLLRVKRAERPSAEFWVRFERELRAKQLAAIVEKRPWWQALPRTFVSLARLHLPLGATAVLALTVFTVREYRRPSTVQETILPVTAPGVMPAGPMEVASNLSTPAMMPAAIPGPARENVAEEATLEISNVRPGEISQFISMLGADSRLDDGQRDSMSSARLTPANLAKIQGVESSLVPALGRTLGFETRGVPARSIANEPLAQVSTPKDQRSARYQERSLPVGYVLEAAVRPSEQRPQNRSSERLFSDDGSRRIGFQNASVNLNF